MAKRSKKGKAPKKSKAKERYLRIPRQWIPGMECLTDKEFRNVILAWVDYATLEDNSIIGKKLSRVEYAAFAGNPQPGCGGVQESQVLLLH